MDWSYGEKILSSGGVSKMVSIGYVPFFYTLVVALFTSLLITHLYLRFYGSRTVGSTIYRSFPMLAISITAIFVSLQFSIPLSLGLLGALSIVRFRTPIKDPEEVGFILLIIAVSICCATFSLVFLSILVSVSIIGLIILNRDKKFFRKNLADGMLIFNMPISDYNQFSSNIIDQIKKDITGKLDSVLENEQDAAISYSFTAMSTEQFKNIKQSVKGNSPSIRVNIHYNSPGEM